MLAVVVWSWDVSSEHSVGVVIRLARSSGREVGVDGQLEQQVGFVGVLFRNELSSLVTCYMNQDIFHYHCAWR